MEVYKMQNGTEITGKMLNHWEDMGKSEVEIGELLGITRAHLWKIRKRIGCRVRFRSDKGVLRVDPDEKRERWNAYMSEYRLRHVDKCRRARIRVGGKVVSRSRHNAAITIGRVLLPEEVVHHIDEDPMNDSYDNLMVFSNQDDHLAYHRGEDISPVAPVIV